jgi:fucose 4-O-acetylase-like acetyltransferase
VIGFPLLIIPFAIYNVIAFMMPFDWNTKLYSFRLPSGLVFEPTASDAFILFSLLMLMFEIIKSTKHGKSLIEHFLALLLVCGAAAEFAMVNPAQLMNQQNVPQQMGNSTFALFVAICAVDLFAGFAAALRRARRKVVVVEEAPVVVQAPAPAPTVVRTEPARVEPAARVEPSPFTPASEPVVRADPVQKIGS